MTEEAFAVSVGTFVCWKWVSFYLELGIPFFGYELRKHQLFEKAEPAS